MPTRKSARPDQQAQEAEDLRDEIEMLREIIRRIGQLVDEGRTLEELLRVLNTTSMACTRILKLIKDQQSTAPDGNAAFSRALKAVLRDMRERKTGYLPPQS